MLLLVLSVLLVITTGCRQERFEPHANKRINTVNPAALRVGLVHQIESLDPVKIKHFGEMQVARAIYETLFALEPDTGRLVPLLAEQWEVSPEGHSYLIRLRQGIKFHSGRELTAEDVKFSWQRVLALGEPVDLANAFLSVAGAIEFASGRALHVTGLEVTDPYTLRINLTKPDNRFLQVLAHPGAAVVDMKVVELVGEYYGEPGDYQSPVVALAGTGPFALVEWIGGVQVTLQAFDQYHGEAPQSKRLEFIQYPDLEMLSADFEAEYLDLALLPNDLYRKYFASPAQTVALPGSDLYYLGFNTGREPFSRLALREAISRCLDRHVLAQIFQGEPLSGLLPRSLMEGRPSRTGYSYQPGAGAVVLPGDEPVPGLTLTHREGEPWASIAAEVKTQLERCGFTVHLQGLPAAEFQRAVRSGEAGFYLDYWQSSTPWAEFFLASHFASPGLANWGGYTNPVVDDRFFFIDTQADDDSERLESLLEIEQLVQEDYAILSLGSSKTFVAFQEDVQDVVVLPPGLVMWEKCSRLPVR